MLLKAEGIGVKLKKENQKKLFGNEKQEILKDAYIDLNKGECVGIIGESGSGKSTFGKVLVGLLKPNSGKVLINGIDTYGKNNKENKINLKQTISIVFQDYTSSVNPRFKVKDVINEALIIKERNSRKKINKEENIKELLKQVGLSENIINRYPHELSGGQLQRVCIARAIAIEPQIILLDEAISSLDASIQTQIMDLLLELKRKYNLSYIFITHDLTAVTYMCDKVLFLNNGRVVEKVDDISKLALVSNEYAKKLLNSVMIIDY
ncbi:dipeptide/oligopeptide/nickel ABC transporter ATP-binding protein [Clostridium sp. SHJSY1]|uniref:ABC transporter ATP-binding protein n=1 Tax=Clostridium sp. SHJSY1 TaxID=2942483 RepID=UPI00287621E0|nr:dipeptide/oligopeptide/nickel ABC transporter ATP-binding protein [Clostridium sp. SHJSY1]MDS0526885.1 dipeptide/oligopeptide/nickel ABC transporter ATP-binding protein [Clostridium sp. SHJSY1]